MVERWNPTNDRRYTMKLSEKVLTVTLSSEAMVAAASRVPDLTANRKRRLGLQ
jgi:hypothetical protein